MSRLAGASNEVAHHKGGDRRLVGHISSAKEPATLFESIRKARRREITASIKRSFQMVDRKGFCLSPGDWRKDVMGVAAPRVTADDLYWRSIAAGLLGYVSAEFLEHEVAPRLVQAANSIARHRA